MELKARVERRKHWLRLGLRALNGMALGALIGGLVGYLLAATSILAVGFNGNPHFSAAWWQGVGAVSCFGIVPGVPGGALIGCTIIVRNARKRLLLATLVGLFAGVAYAAFWHQAFQSQQAVLAAMILSGLAGGTLMAWFLSGLRRHWNWWTRWEEPLHVC